MKLPEGMDNLRIISSLRREYGVEVVSPIFFEVLDADTAANLTMTLEEFDRDNKLDQE